jgi:hypothetical protein
VAFFEYLNEVYVWLIKYWTENCSRQNLQT